MAVEHFKLGCAHLYFDSVEIGISSDGVDVGIDPRWNDIATDCYGGRSGPPGESQLLGAIVRVAAEITAYEKNKLHRFPAYNPDHADLVNGIGEVAMPEIGTFVRQGNNPLGRTLDIRGTVGRLVLPFAFLRQPQDFNLGTKSSLWNVGWECWLDGVQSRKLMEWKAAI